MGVVVDTGKQAHSKENDQHDGNLEDGEVGLLVLVPAEYLHDESGQHGEL